MKKANKTRYLPPREKRCSVSLMDTWLQRCCNHMWFKLEVKKQK